MLQRKEVTAVVTENIFDSSFKEGVQISSDQIAVYSQLTNGEILKRLLMESFLTEHCGLIFPRNHKFYEVIDLKLQQLHSTGILRYHMDYNGIPLSSKKYLNPGYFRKPKLLTREYLEDIYPKSFPDGPKVFSLQEHLEAGFVIWLVSIAIACVVFILEWMITLKDYFIIKALLEAYFSQRRN